MTVSVRKDVKGPEPARGDIMSEEWRCIQKPGAEKRTDKWQQ